MKRFLPIVAIAALGLAACEQTPTEPSANGSAVTTVSTLAPMSAGERGSHRINNWHLHDLPYGSATFIDEFGVTHKDYDIWPLVWEDYTESDFPKVSCNDGAEKLLVGQFGVVNGSKFAAGTCRNSLYIIQLQVNATGARAPAKWEMLDLGFGAAFPYLIYYRLTPR